MFKAYRAFVLVVNAPVAMVVRVGAQVAEATRHQHARTILSTTLEGMSAARDVWYNATSMKDVIEGVFNPEYMRATEARINTMQEAWRDGIKFNK
jgi:hypothetical protein